MAVIALDLGGTKLAAAVVSARGKILHSQVAPLAGRRGKDVGRLIAQELRALWNAQRGPHKIVAIGVSVPGISYSRTGRVWAPNIPGWENYPLRREIQTALGGKRIPVCLDNDRACCIVGEAWQGAAQSCRDAVFLSVGTGIGAGILIDGQYCGERTELRAPPVGWH